MAYKREEQEYQPEGCIDCKLIWGLDCPYGKRVGRSFLCIEKKPMRPINGKIHNSKHYSG